MKSVHFQQITVATRYRKERRGKMGTKIIVSTDDAEGAEILQILEGAFLRKKYRIKRKRSVTNEKKRRIITYIDVKKPVAAKTEK